MFENLVIQQNENNAQIQNQTVMPDPYAINVYMVPNLYCVIGGITFIKIPKKGKYGVEYIQYIFSSNIALLRIAEFTCNGKSIVWFNLGTNIMLMEKSNITGLKLLDRLAQIGVDFCIDAPKYKRGEAINQLIFKNLSVKQPIEISEEDYAIKKEACVK